MTKRIGVRIGVGAAAVGLLIAGTIPTANGAVVADAQEDATLANIGSTLFVTAPGMDDQANVVTMQERTGDLTQLWAINDDGQIISHENELCLAIETISFNDAVTLKPCGGGDAQSWRMEELDAYRVFVNAATGTCLTQPGPLGFDKTVRHKPCDEKNELQWFLVESGS